MVADQLQQLLLGFLVLADLERCDEAAFGEVEDDGIAVAEGAACDAVVVVGDVTEYLQRQAERFGEEGGNPVVAAVGAGEDPADLAALIAGVRPVLDAPLAAGERVEEAGDVAGSVDVGYVRFEAFVDDDALADGDAAVVEERNRWRDADADDGEACPDRVS